MSEKDAAMRVAEEIVPIVIAAAAAGDDSYPTHDDLDAIATIIRGGFMTVPTGAGVTPELKESARQLAAKLRGASADEMEGIVGVLARDTETWHAFMSFLNLARPPRG